MNISFLQLLLLFFFIVWNYDLQLYQIEKLIRFYSTLNVRDELQRRKKEIDALAKVGDSDVYNFTIEKNESEEEHDSSIKGSDKIDLGTVTLWAFEKRFSIRTHSCIETRFKVTKKEKKNKT